MGKVLFCRNSGIPFLVYIIDRVREGKEEEEEGKKRRRKKEKRGGVIE